MKFPFTLSGRIEITNFGTCGSHKILNRIRFKNFWILIIWHVIIIATYIHAKHKNKNKFLSFFVYMPYTTANGYTLNACTEEF